MPLIVPTTGGFSIGSNVATAEPKTSMNMSLGKQQRKRRLYCKKKNYFILFYFK